MKILFCFAVIATISFNSYGALLDFDYKLTCSNNGQMTDLDRVTERLSQSCIKNKNGVPGCLDTKGGLDTSEGWIDLQDGMKSYYSNRSGKYSIEMLKEVIRYSLNEGFDPFVALAIVSMESPQIYKGRTDQYRNSWGNPPVDGPAAASAVNCIRIGKGDIGEIPVSNRNSSLTEIVINTQGERLLFSMNNIGMTSTFGPVRSNAEVQEILKKVKKNKAPKGCYFWVSGVMVDHIKFNPDTEHLYKEENSKIRSQMGILFMKKKFNHVRHLISMDKGVWVKTQTWKDKHENPYYQMSMMAQSYNGYGTLGVTEGLDNMCLNGMNMSENPIYGSGVMHLALNMYLGNSDIHLMIDEVVVEEGLSNRTSEFCKYLGQGEHHINSKSFLGVQQNILNSQPNCQTY
ncbi:MAG: hypothetical protein HOO06_01220 [Bdellovibrionaceae bacterium]|nr:hypothetical protein [Pseudobdellovibrionaceae bacterium]